MRLEWRQHQSCCCFHWRSWRGISLINTHFSSSTLPVAVELRAALWLCGWRTAGDLFVFLHTSLSLWANDHPRSYSAGFLFLLWFPSTVTSCIPPPQAPHSPFTVMVKLRYHCCVWICMYLTPRPQECVCTAVRISERVYLEDFLGIFKLPIATENW